MINKKLKTIDSSQLRLCSVYVLKLDKSDLYITDYNIAGHSISFSQQKSSLHSILFSQQKSFLVYYSYRKDMVTLACSLSYIFGIRIVPCKIGSICCLSSDLFSGNLV